MIILHTLRSSNTEDAETVDQDGFNAQNQPEAGLGQFGVLGDKAVLIIITMQLGSQLRQEISDAMRFQLPGCTLHQVGIIGQHF